MTSAGKEATRRPPGSPSRSPSAFSLQRNIFRCMEPAPGNRPAQIEEKAFLSVGGPDARWRGAGGSGDEAESRFLSGDGYGWIMGWYRGKGKGGMKRCGPCLHAHC
ncbi:hypothetical protein E4U27_005376 [Claviceps purpurea]|nr:hypothetical protein E4U27_005376 [Claviceps purpurea]